MGIYIYRHLGSCNQPAVADGDLLGDPTSYLLPYCADVNFMPFPSSHSDFHTWHLLHFLI